MKNRFLSVCFVLLVSTLISSCFFGYYGNGDIVKQERAVRDFKSIELTGVGDIYIYPGNEFKVIVITDSNLQNYVSATAIGKNLRIKQTSNINFNPTEFAIEVYLPELESVSMSGAGYIEICDGKATDLNIEVSGSGGINTLQYEVENITIDLSGAGSAKLWATKSIKGSISGVGNVKYKGNPTLNVDVSGMGKFGPL